MDSQIIDSNSESHAYVRPKAANQESTVALEHVVSALRGLRFGTVTIIVQDGRIVQIERNEKTRLRKPE